MNATALHSAPHSGRPASTAVRPPATVTRPLPGSGISELFLTPRSPDLSILLLPLLAHLSQDDSRWITWVGPQRIARSLLQSYGVDVTRVRFVTTTANEDQRWMFWEALNAGTSHTVISCGTTYTEEDLHYLEQAAHQGNSRALLIRQQS